jgi:hypothetical protein
MKKHFFLFAFFALFATAAFAGSNPMEKALDSSISLQPASTDTGIQLPGEDSEALHCTVTNGTITVSCWLCNCGKLYEAVFGGQPVNQGGQEGSGGA